MNPDGHPNHFGAWPADVYYGDDDLIDWTDDNYEDSIQNGTRVRDAQYNIASDGKYDQVQTPSELVLKIGRVDLSNMSSFSKSEKDLLKQYLDKDHAYRTGALTAPERGLIDDNFGYMSGEAFAASGWRNFAPLVGADSIHAVDFFTTLATDNYLWAYGCGGGWDQGASGVGATTDFASKPTNAIFTMLFGSYFGDWNVSDNFLRAPLCNDHSLICAWSGRPYWLFFPMGLGHTTGDCALLTQNNDGDFDANIISTGVAAWQVHEALMGDPTLRMRPFVAPNSLTLSEDHAANSVTLVWPQDAALRGYNVYRASVRSNHMTLLTPQPIAAGTFTDASPLADTAYYLVRGVRDESTKSGNYLNLAYGASAVSNGGFNDAGVLSHQLSDNISVIYPEAGTVATIVLDRATSARARIEVLDVQGRVIATLADGVGTAGTSRYDWNFATVPNGVYFVRAVGEGMAVSTKILVRKD